MPRKRTQMAMPATDRGSQDSAGELEVKYEPTNNMDQNSPTHVPQNIQQENERLWTTLRMLQEEMQKSKEREKAVLNDLRKEIQQAQAKLRSEQQQQNWSNISTQHVIEKQRNNIVSMSQLAWIDHGFKLNGRDNFALWKRTILRDAEYTRARELLEKGEPEEQQMDPVKKAEIETKSILLHIRIFAMLPLDIQQELEPDRILKPQEIWRRLNIYICQIWSLFCGGKISPCQNFDESASTRKSGSHDATMGRARCLNERKAIHCRPHIPRYWDNPARRLAEGICAPRTGCIVRGI